MTLPSPTVSDLSLWHKDHSFSLRIILYKCTFYVGRKSTNPMSETHGREERGLYESHKINGFCVQGKAQNSGRSYITFSVVLSLSAALTQAAPPHLLPLCRTGEPRMPHKAARPYAAIPALLLHRAPSAFATTLSPVQRPRAC